MTLRQQEIYAWLSSLLPDVKAGDLKYLQADASHRKYARLQTNDNSFVIMDTTPDQEIINFTKIAKILSANKITVPEIIHCNHAAGLILMSDLGSETYQQALNGAAADKIDSLYLDAINTLIKMQRIDTSDVRNDYRFNAMHEPYIQQRLEIFKTWYLQKHLGLELDTNIENIINRMQTLFTQEFAQIQHTFVHVDYHCRNLMALHANNPGVLDFQDAMIGPITYDLVSLLQDAYIIWPRRQVESLVTLYQDMAQEAGVLAPISTERLLRSFDLVGLQRHIKNLGIFARLHHRDGKSNYLQDMPTLMHYITETCSRYGDLSWLLNFIEVAVAE